MALSTFVLDWDLLPFARRSEWLCETGMPHCSQDARGRCGLLLVDSGTHGILEEMEASRLVADILIAFKAS